MVRLSSLPRSSGPPFVQPRFWKKSFAIADAWPRGHLCRPKESWSSDGTTLHSQAVEEHVTSIAFVLVIAKSTSWIAE
jgi:hypothetical protein